MLDRRISSFYDKKVRAACNGIWTLLRSDGAFKTQKEGIEYYLRVEPSLTVPDPDDLDVVLRERV